MSSPQPAAAPPPHPPLPVPQAMAYMGAAAVLALAQGLGQGFVSANIPTIAGDLGVTTTQASWLVAAYMIPRAALPLMLIKLRTQFGLRRFAEISIIIYVVMAFVSIWMSDLRSGVMVQALSGIAAAPISSLAFMYMLEPLSQAWKMRLGLPMALLLLMSGPSLARVVSPALIGDGGLQMIHLTALGMALVSLALVYLLPLRPVPRVRVIEPLDFVSFALISAGFGGMIVSFVMGPIHQWTAEPWIGWLLALSVAALAATVMIELNRKTPILDIRWLTSPAILHLTATLFLFRLILSEQSAGAPRMFQALGVGSEQMTTLFSVILMASLMGALACVAWMKPAHVPRFHLVALVLIMAGAWMDSGSTTATRPDDMIVSQALIGFAGILFMVPAMMAGLLAALARGPQYLLSFVIVFISTQSLGGVLGAGLFSSIITNRQAVHLQVLSEQLTASDPQVVVAITARAAALAPQIADAAQRRTQAVSALAREVSQQATVLAYNDAYFLTFLIASLAAAVLLLHLLYNRLHALFARQHPATGIETTS